MSVDAESQDKIAKYLARSRQAVETGKLVLATKGLERSKHSGVIATFRQHFVKTGLIEPEFSRFYGAAMDEHHAGDYDLIQLDYDSASRHVTNAAKFLNQIEQVLHEAGFKNE